MDTPGFIITGCTIKDGPALAYNNISAFWQDENYIAAWRHTTLEKHIVEVSKRMPRNLLKDRGVLRHQKAVDATGKVVGYARWILPDSMGRINGVYAWPEAIVPAVSAEQEAEIRATAASANFQPGEDENDQEFEDKVQEIKKRLLVEKQYLRLDYLAVHPNEQGRGIATALVISGVDQAKKLGLDVFVLAFPRGFRLYEKLNFRVLEGIKAKDTAYGGNYSMRFMTTAVES